MDIPTGPQKDLKLLRRKITRFFKFLYRGTGKTKFAIVRFGNVIGSRGSVFQIFLHQIKNNQPITVTDPNMTRFIMSISEAASMILEVTSIAIDGEIFILKMPSVRIEDLAYAMLNSYKSRFDGKNFPSVKIFTAHERR